MATYRVYINIVGNASKALNGLLKDVAGLNKGIAGTISKFGAMGRVASGAFKAISNAAMGIAKLNLGYTMLGPKALSSAANFLTGPKFEAGVTLLQRREQARRGFGAQFAKAQQQADLLAVSYGLNPADVIASLNVLTGMKVGSKRLSMGHAARLVQAGGLISQQGGVSYENVMLNLQQLMAQDQLHSRDIKQLLTHAPILGRYAIDEMEKKGIVGQTAQEYFKGDKGALLSVLERYLAETPGLVSTRARGIAQQAQLGFFAKLAGNPAWLTVADKYAHMMEVLGTSISKGLTALTNSDTIRTSVNSFITLVDKLPQALENAQPTIDKFIKRLYKVAGVSFKGSKAETFRMGEQEKWVEQTIGNNIPSLRIALSQAGFVVPEDDAAVASLAASAIGAMGGAGKYVTPMYPLEEVGAYKLPQAVKAFPEGFKGPLGGLKYYGTGRLSFMSGALKERKAPGMFISEDYAQTGYLAGTVNFQKILSDIGALTPEQKKLLGFSEGTSDGSSMAGYGRDRKALTINFYAPIVEWESTINTDDPNEVVQEVSTSIEGAASRAIQIALQGATGKMNIR